MTASIISARGLGKSYVLGRAGTRTLREAVIDAARGPFRWLGRERRPVAEPFWALRDVSFEVPEGEAVGIVGRNGAGKSTLLKILSRITAPSTGEVRLRGKVASLLEVGTGFHAELSGRENIFLNGAIMGMSRTDVRTRFDEIVAFAEVDKFLDTPVKRYSSGMYVRLAFAVAAHLEPDILIVDEVLAVGDAAFQKKCLGKMQTVASGGRTVLFVSHNMAAVSRLCTRGLLLSHGLVAADGPISKVVGTYIGGTHGETPASVDFTEQQRIPSSDDVRLLAARLTGDGLRGIELDIRRPLLVEIDFEVLQARYPLHPNVHVYNDQGQCVFITSDAHVHEYRRARAPGRYRATVEIPGNFLSEGMFSLDVAISTVTPLIVHVHERGLLTLNVVDPGEGDSLRGDFAGDIPGAVRPTLPWKTERLGEILNLKDREIVAGPGTKTSTRA
jgi:lipopolysaccharide transport system ATP-binding protein